MGRRLAWVAIAAVGVLGGCADEPAQSLVDWTFVQGNRSQAISLPTHVDELLSERGGHFELVTVARVPEALRGQPLTLTFTRLPALAALEVDGRAVESEISGLFRDYRSPGAQRWRIPGALTGAAELELRVTVQDTWFQASWIGSTPELSPHPDGSAWFRFVTAFNTATAAAALATVMLLSLSYALIFLGDRTRRDHGWLAAQAASAASYPLLALGASQVVLGDRDPALLAFVAIAALLSVPYSHEHFRLRGRKSPWLVLGIVNIITMAALSGPYSSRHGVAIVAPATIAIVAAYQLYLGIVLIRDADDRGDALIQTASWLTLSVFACPDVLMWLGFGNWLEGLHGGSLGIACYATLQATVLGREHARVMRSLDEANTELEARVALLEARDRENQQLTGELKRQIAARSRQLTHALARLGRSAHSLEDLAPGTVVDDRYRVVTRIGDGAMAVVYEVERLEDGQRMALKTLRSASDARQLARFAREAHIAAEVAHPNVVAIHDIDFATAGFMYVVMELVHGPSLRAESERYGDTGWAVEILLQVCHGLSALHAHGVIHRDLKPANILLTERDGALVVKIADFGVSGAVSAAVAGSRPRAGAARALVPSEEEATMTGQLAVTGPVQIAALAADAGATNRTAEEATLDTPAGGGAYPPELTQAGHVLGTPAYMAPEAPDGGRDPARDIYSLGVIAHELVAGRRPHHEVPFLCRLAGRPVPEPTPLGDAVPGVDPELAALVDASLATDPATRPPLARWIETLSRLHQREAAAQVSRSSFS